MKKLNKKAKAAVSIFTSVAVVISIMAPVLTLAPQLAYAADTGWNSPDSNVGNDNSGDDWSDAHKAYSNGSGFAYEQNGERHRYYDFDISIFAGSTINGIEAAVDAWSSDPSGCQIGVDLSWDGGATWSNEKTQNLTGSEATGTLGNSTDEWGTHDWQSTDFSNTNFRVRVHDIDPGINCNNDATTSLDWLRIKIYYTLPQVTICHNAGGSGNFTQLTVDANAVDGVGGGDHNSGGHQGGKDIIPPGSWDANGRNWDAAGQAIWNNGCVVPTEICDGQDNDFDGNTDEDGVCPANSYYCDNDQDSYIGVSPSGTCDTYQCVPSGCSTSQGDDCDDSNAGINPDATEVCGNQIDEDCDGSDLECVYTCSAGQGGVTCNDHFYEDYCEVLSGVNSWANARVCNAPSGPSCGTLVGITRTSCDDQNVCTTDSCGSGQCVHADVTCFDNDPCTDDSCDPVSGCVFTPNGQCVPECITEGNNGAVVPGQVCCEGLDPIGTGAPDQSGNCPEPPPVGAFVCTMCGNGTCGLGENKCNCPQDCAEPTTDYCGMYFNHIPYPDNMDFQKPGQIFGLNPGDNPFNHPTWWNIAKLVFVATDSNLAFGDNFLPVNQGYAGDPFHFTAKWQAKLIVPADGNYGYSLRSDDDSWLYIDGTMVEDLGGVHAPITRTDSVYLTQGEHTFNLYFAERHTTQSYLDFHWTTPGIEIIADCEEYCGDQTCNGQETCDSCQLDCGECPVATCGDGIVNQTSEECDGQAGVPEHYTCTTECTLQYVPWCGDQTCNDEETCETCSNDCGLCPCDPNVELVLSGGFEEPTVETQDGWDIFGNQDLIGWVASWLSMSPSEWGGYARPDASLELHRGVNSWDSQGGSYQHAELDGDWYGPGHSQSGEPASTVIYQDLNTIPGRQYTVSFWFSPRPNTALENNRLEFSWDGSVVDNNIEGAGESNTNWVQKTYTLTAAGTTTRIQFADIGVPSNSEGTFVDSVSVKCCADGPVCDPSPEICTDQIDNDCDGLIDCADSDCVEDPSCIQVGCQPGATEACETGLLGICAAGTRTCTEHAVWGECIQNNESSTEICGNQIDEDCDGSDATCLPFCGDGSCNDEETCGSCPQDCGSCGGGTSAVVTGGGGGGHLVVCGDGIREYTEMCDDGNKIDGDGCSAACGVELVLGASTQQGEVLGESTTLPQTGEDAVLLIISSIIVALGAGFGLRKKLAVK
jgi:fibro-slime domain-containing protein/LPXTG-motif cell wall-anchored protein